MDIINRRSIGQMPFRRRQHGLSALDIFNLKTSLKFAAVFLSISTMIAVPQTKILFIILAALKLIGINQHLQYIRDPLDPIDHRYKNRTIESFTEEECYRELRFRKDDLKRLIQLLQFPPIIVLPNNCTCNGEYALCLMLYRLSYPSTLARLQSLFGRDYCQLSRIFNYAIDFVYDNHKHRVTDVAWYAPRLNYYNTAIRRKIAESNVNNNHGHVPGHLNDIYGFIDGTHRPVCRLQVSGF